MGRYELKYTAEQIDDLLESVEEKTIYNDATQSERGLMSATDKSKLNSLPTSSQIDTSLSGKVDKVEGKGLSENDYTDDEKASVASAYHKPQSGVPKSDLAQSVQTSLSKADTALQSFTEQDPTVPDWAKQQNKPSYTYNEIANTPDLSGYVLSSSLANVATSGSYNDLTNKPTIPAAQVNSDWNASSGVAQILNKPTIPVVPTNVSAFTNDAGYLTSHQSLTNYIQKSQTAGLIKNDGTIDTTSYGTYSKPSGGIPASDLESGVIPTVPTISTDIETDKASNAKTASPKAVYDEVHPAVGSAMPQGGMLPNVLYNLGTLSGSVTIALATPIDNTIENEYKFTFNADSTAPTITWPASVTKWIGNSLDNNAPKVDASEHYECSIIAGYGIFNKF